MKAVILKFNKFGSFVFIGFIALIGVFMAISSPEVASSDTTSTLTQSASFNSGSIDIWAPFGGETDWTLIHAPFGTGDLTSKTVVSVPAAGGVTTNFNISGCGEDLLDCFSNPDDYFSVSLTSADIGAGAKFNTNGHITFLGEAEDLSGSASVSYPVSTNITYPTAESFMTGDTISIGGSWTMASGATILAGETRGDIQFDGDFGLHGYLDLCGYGPGEDCGAVIPSFGFESGQTTLFSVGALDPVPTIPTGLVGVGGEMNYLSVTPTTITTAGNTVTAKGSNQFSDIEFDLDQIAKTIVVPSGAKVPALEGSINMTDTGIPFSSGYNIFDADAHVTLRANQELTFKDSEVRVRHSFSSPMAGFSGPYLDKAGDNSWVEFMLGDDVEVEWPTAQTQPVTVTPTVYLDGTLHNLTKLETDGLIELAVGSFNISVPGFVIVPAVGGFSTGLQYPEPIFEDHWHDVTVLGVTCSGCLLHIHDAGVRMHDINVPSFGPWSFPTIGPVDLGPAWGPEQYANSETNDGLANGDMPVSSFAPITLSTFVLNPQNKPVAVAGEGYTVNEGSSVTLDASASSDADGDTMTYEWDFENNGSIDATGVTVPYFGVDGPSTHDVRLKVCDTNSNCTEDMTSVTVVNVAPTAILNVPTIVGEDHPLILSLTNANDVSAPDVTAGFRYAFDCKDGGGYSAWSTSNTITCTGTLDGVHTVKGKIKDKDNGVSEYTGTVMLDRTPPEAYNQFDPVTKNVLVFGRDGLSGVSSTAYAPISVVPISWSNDGILNAELRTFRIVDGAGNSVVLKERVKKTGTEIKVEVTSLRYNNGATITPATNSKHFEWALAKDGSVKTLNQKMAVGTGLFKRSVDAKWDITKNVTTIKASWSLSQTKSGLVLLRLISDEGDLVIEY